MEIMKKGRKQEVGYPIPCIFISQIQHLTHFGMNHVEVMSMIKQRFRDRVCNPLFSSFS